MDREKTIHRMLLGRAALSGPILDVDRLLALRPKLANGRRKKVRTKRR